MITNEKLESLTDPGGSERERGKEREIERALLVGVLQKKSHLLRPNFY